MTKSDPHRDAVLKACGANVRRCREEAGLQQKELAERAELSPTYLSRVERGEINISVVNLAKLARALEVEPASLLEGLS
jgi:transcriptional regulator with XRE-family HTH domain